MNTASVEEPALMVEKITGRTRDTPGVNKQMNTCYLSALVKYLLVHC
jgi:hypothetical protein